jgi:hypothetical protein
MPRNATILLIRHAEKPAAGVGLAVAGQARAQAYVVYFQHLTRAGDPVATPRYLVAAATSPSSHRPTLTLAPLATALALAIDATHADTDYDRLADELLHHSSYDGVTTLVCWRHKQILDFARALGADATQLPPQAHWPAVWPDAVFGWLLQLCYDADGTLLPLQTCCVSEQLMYADYGQQP